MKIDVGYILRDHFRTLRNAETGKASVIDLILFYVVPALMGVSAYYYDVKVSKSDVYNVSITFFGIFIALLLNIQVAIFAILQRRWKQESEERMQVYQDEKFKTRQILLSELNANLSYLILFCCAALFASLAFFVKECLSGFGPAAMIFIYMHFLFTLVMIVKRTHVLFQSEYNEHTGT